MLNVNQKFIELSITAIIVNFAKNLSKITRRLLKFNPFIHDVHFKLNFKAYCDSILKNIQMNFKSYRDQLKVLSA